MYMGKRVEPKERIAQKSIGFHARQLQFLDWHNENYKEKFDVDHYARVMLDEQIAEISPKYLADTDARKLVGDDNE